MEYIILLALKAKIKLESKKEKADKKSIVEIRKEEAFFWEKNEFRRFAIKDEENPEEFLNESNFYCLHYFIDAVDEMPNEEVSTVLDELEIEFEGKKKEEVSHEKNQHGRKY